MTEITCPRCQATGELGAMVRAVAICAKCGASLYLDENSIRVAKFADLETMTPEEMATLRKARASHLSR